MLDDLVGCIEVLKKRIETHGSTLIHNEWRTRVQLIDPLLSTLGWDVSDPTLVTPEYKTSDGRADYALLRKNQNPAAILEAKNLGESLDSGHCKQMLTYANMEGIAYAGLTNGDHWEFYSVFEHLPLKERQLLNITITGSQSQVTALKLLLLWRANLESDLPISASTPILADSVNENNVSTSKVPEYSSTPFEETVIQDEHKEIESTGWILLSEYNPPKGTASPTAIKFQDGSAYSLNHWYELYVEVVGKLYGDGILKHEDTPIKWSKQLYSIHTEAIHPTGKKFRRPRKVKGLPPIYVDVNLSAHQIRSNSVRLLKKYGLNPADVRLEIAS